jgi:excisionase family DNA binding protein
VYKAFSREGQAYYSIWFTNKTTGEDTYGSGKNIFRFQASIINSMPYKLNKIIFKRDNIQDYETNTHPLDTEIDFPFVASKLQELIPKEHQYGKKSRLEISTSPLFNASGLTKLIPELGPKGIYYLELRPEHKLKLLVVEPEDVVVDIYIGPKLTLIYSFYNPTRKNFISITASIEKDKEYVYTKLKSDLTDIYWRQYFIKLALNKIEDTRSELKVSTNMTADEVVKYLQLDKKTIRKWTSEGKIPNMKLGSAVRYRKVQIDR